MQKEEGGREQDLMGAGPHRTMAGQQAGLPQLPLYLSVKPRDSVSPLTPQPGSQFKCPREPGDPCNALGPKAGPPLLLAGRGHPAPGAGVGPQLRQCSRSFPASPPSSLHAGSMTVLVTSSGLLPLTQSCLCEKPPVPQMAEHVTPVHGQRPNSASFLPKSRSDTKL